MKGKNSIFADSMIEKMSREDITVTIFDKSGKMVFNSRGTHQPLHKTTAFAVKNERNGKFDGMVGREAIIRTTPATELAMCRWPTP